MRGSAIGRLLNYGGVIGDGILDNLSGVGGVLYSAISGSSSSLGSSLGRSLNYGGRINSGLLDSPLGDVVKVSKVHNKFGSKMISTDVTEDHVKGKCLPSQRNKVFPMVTTSTYIPAAMRAVFITTSTHTSRRQCALWWWASSGSRRS